MKSLARAFATFSVGLVLVTVGLSNQAASATTRPSHSPDWDAALNVFQDEKWVLHTCTDSFANVVQILPRRTTKRIDLVLKGAPSKSLKALVSRVPKAVTVRYVQSSYSLCDMQVAISYAMGNPPRLKNSKQQVITAGQIDNYGNFVTIGINPVIWNQPSKLARVEHQIRVAVATKSSVPVKFLEQSIGRLT